MSPGAFMSFMHMGHYDNSDANDTIRNVAGFGRDQFLEIDGTIVWEAYVSVHKELIFREPAEWPHLIGYDKRAR